MNASGDVTKSKLAVLLLGFGGPERFEDVRPFIENVVRGRNVPESRIELVVGQYKKIGGRSPFNELTAKQAAALQQMLYDENIEPKGNAEGHRPSQLQVYTGMLFWNPSIEKTLQQMKDDGVEHAVAIIMAPQRTQASHQRYIEAASQAQAKIKDAPSLTYVPSWNTHPLFIEAVVERIVQELSKLSQQQLSDCQLIFTAHSVPLAMADSSNYAQEIQQTANAVTTSLNKRYGMEFCAAVAYQSRSGSPADPWLQPDPNNVMDTAAQAGKKIMVVVPVGFVCDHVEVLYDIDILAGDYARQSGLSMLRAGTAGSHPLFIQLLSSLARTAIESCHAKSNR